MTFYLFNLTITCYVISYVIRYCIVCKHDFQWWRYDSNKNLYYLKGYNARQLRTEFPDKGWTKSSINRLLKKFRDTDTVDRRQASIRSRSARADENTDQVNDMVLSQEDQPRTHSTVREISRGQAFLRHLQLKCFKRRRAQELTEANYTSCIFPKKT